MVILLGEIRWEYVLEYSKDINSLLGNQKSPPQLLIEDPKAVLKVNIWFQIFFFPSWEGGGGLAVGVFNFILSLKQILVNVCSLYYLSQMRLVTFWCRKLRSQMV